MTRSLHRPRPVAPSLSAAAAALWLAATTGPAQSQPAQPAQPTPQPTPPPAAAPSESPAERDARMAWWREARFGMFIHWGLYAIPAGEWKGTVAEGPSEWLPSRLGVPASEWERLREQFNPVMFDADAWAKAAKRAGMKYIVITSKHHDGFALYDSAHTDWDLGSTPFKRDPLRELAQACQREGIRFCLYHSIVDWHHPDYLPRPKWDPRPRGDADMNRYVGFMKDQLRELLTNYGPIGVLWFDGEWEGSWTTARGKDLDAYIRGLQPDIIINNRVDKGRKSYAGLNREGTWAGDFGTPEQEVPAEGLPGVDWESCITMNNSWGYRKDDHKWKSSTQIVRTLVDIASKGGNLLLNVGPTADGLIPEASLARLADVARWMDINSESIHGTHAGPFPSLPWGRCTAKPGVLYLHVFDWPADGVLRVPGLRNELAGDASLLGTPNGPTARRAGNDIELLLPPTPPQTAVGSNEPTPVWVIRLPIVGEPDVTAPADAPPSPAATD